MDKSIEFWTFETLAAAPAERASGTDAAGSSRCAEPAPAVGQVSARALRPRKRPPLATTELRDCACRGVGAEPAAPALNTPQSRGVVVAGPRLSGMHGRGVGAVISCALGVCQGEVRDVQPDSRSVQRLWGTARRVNGAPRPYHERDMRGVRPRGVPCRDIHGVHCKVRLVSTAMDGETSSRRARHPIARKLARQGGWCAPTGSGLKI